MQTKSVALALDVGGRRIGLALGDTEVRIAAPLGTLSVDGAELAQLQEIIREHAVSQLVVGLPRNQAGEETAQSQQVRAFAAQKLQPLGLPIAFQDESVTSVIAEQRLGASRKPISKASIDAEAAAVILQDYLEASHG